jgi:DNA-binding PadR family transcriptional regulator
MTNKPTERKLNDDQQAILKLLLKFRFITRQSITKLFANSHPGMDVYRKLQVLEKRGLIAKRFESSYRLLGKPAAYYLLPEGGRKLQDDKDAAESKTRIKAIYKDKSVSEQFIDECHDIFNTYVSLNEHNAGLKFFTKADLNHEDYEYFPQPLPDAYVKLHDGKHFFLQVRHAHQPFFVATRVIKRYMDYFENGIWDDTGTDFPITLFVVDSIGIQKRLNKFMSKNAEDIRIYTALRNDVIDGSSRIWHNADEPEETYSLKELTSIDSV